MIRGNDGAPILVNFWAPRSAYSAPERYTSDADRYGPWTGIYGLAATLYRAISGSCPTKTTKGQLSDDLKSAILVAKVPYRDSFLKAIEWAMKLQTNERPQSVADWRKMLLDGSSLFRS